MSSAMCWKKVDVVRPQPDSGDLGIEALKLERLQDLLGDLTSRYGRHPASGSMRRGSYPQSRPTEESRGPRCWRRFLSSQDLPR